MDFMGDQMIWHTQSSMDRQPLRQQNPRRVKSQPAVIFKSKAAEGGLVRAALRTLLATAFRIGSYSLPKNRFVVLSKHIMKNK